MNASAGLRALCLFAAFLALPAARAGEPPNVVFILADDLGYGDLGVYGQTDYRTPQLDKLAAEGMRFTQAYANSAVCSASRMALITGRYQYRLRGGLEEPLAEASDSIGLPPSHPTLPSLLKKVGYNTALLGKWHLGSLPNFGPLKSGYDTFFGNYGGGTDYFTHVGTDMKDDLYEGETLVRQAGYYTELLGRRAVAYLNKQEVGKPFFLSLHYSAPHWPWEGPDDEAVSRTITNLGHPDGGSLEVYGKMVVALDESIGTVLQALQDKGLAENTIVIFSSDNGGERYSRTWPLTGQKTELLEGGIRVPAIVRWPRGIGAGQVTTQVAIGMDWMPTLLAAARSQPDPAYPADGHNLLPVLQGRAPLVERTLSWRYKANAQRALRSGNWKYLRIRDNEFLFDVVADPHERANLAGKQPELLAKLRAQWEAWNAEMLPITKEVYSHAVTGKFQADRYGVGAETNGRGD